MKLKSLLWSSGVGLTLASCSAASTSPSGSPSAESGETAGTSPGGSGATSQGGSNANTGGVYFTPPDDSGGSGGIAPEDTCGATSLRAEKLTETRIETRTEIRTETRTETEVQTQSEPVAIYIMLDQSGSMLPDKWIYAAAAITDFINAPSSAGLDVAIQYFPLYIPPCIPVPAGCDGAPYAVPEVDFGRLVSPAGAGTHNQALIDSLGVHAPCGAGTPIEPALRGVTDACIAFEAQNPGEDCVALFITDGEPSTCDQTQQGLSDIAAAALAAGVETYTVGMPGANAALLDAIALAGGTDCDPSSSDRACDASNQGQFAAALELIRETVTTEIEVEVQVEVPYDVEFEVEEEVTVPLDCEWALPQSTTDEDTDPEQVNVKFTDQGTGSTTTLGRVARQTDCPNFENAWYYDDPANPTRLMACDEVCSVIKAVDAQIDILVGCATELAIPR